MPSNLVLKYAKETGKSVGTVENLWGRAKEIAGKKFSENDPAYYAYTTAILKNMLSINMVSVSRKGDEDFEVEVMDGEDKDGEDTDEEGGYEEAKTDSTGKPLEVDRNWWDRLSIKGQKEYIQAHPLTREKIRKDAGLDVDPHLAREPEPEKEPESIHEITPNYRTKIHQHLNKLLTKLDHFPISKRNLLKTGVKLFNKITGREKLSRVEHNVLKGAASLLMGVALASSFLFLPMQPFSLHLASAYIDSLHFRKRGGDDQDQGYDETTDQESVVPVDQEEKLPVNEPTVVQELPELKNFTPEEQQNLQFMSQDMLDWVSENPEERLAEAKRRKQMEEELATKSPEQF